MQTVIPLGVRRETQVVATDVTSAWGGDGELVVNETASTTFTLSNIGAWPFEFRIDAGDWTRLELRNSIQMDVSLASTAIRLRRSEFGGDSVAQLEIKSLTAVYVADGTTVELGGAGGGAAAFTDLTDAPTSYTGKAGQVTAVNDAEDGLTMIHRAAPYTYGGITASGTHALAAARFGLASMDYMPVNGGGAPVAITLPDAADVVAAHPWIAEAPGLTAGVVVGFTIRVFNQNNIGTGQVSFIDGEGVEFFGNNVVEKTWNDFFVNVVYNDPETPLAFEIYSAGGMSDAVAS